jgi:hypothetical protein
MDSKLRYSKLPVEAGDIFHFLDPDHEVRQALGIVKKFKENDWINSGFIVEWDFIDRKSSSTLFDKDGYYIDCTSGGNIFTVYPGEKQSIVNLGQLTDKEILVYRIKNDV